MAPGTRTRLHAAKQSGDQARGGLQLLHLLFAQILRTPQLTPGPLGVGVLVVDPLDVDGERFRQAGGRGLADQPEWLGLSVSEAPAELLTAAFRALPISVFPIRARQAVLRTACE